MLPIAERVEEKLGRSTVFLDAWYEHWLPGQDADVLLQKLYRGAELVVMCVSGAYGDKPWPRTEHRAVRARLMEVAAEERNQIYPIRVGDGEVEGVLLNQIVPDFRDKTAEKAAELIVARLSLAREGAGVRPAAARRTGDVPVLQQPVVGHEVQETTGLEVFISYRRDLDAVRAVLLDREISGAFNSPGRKPSVVVYRHTSERHDVSWPEEARDRCGAADIVLVVIGPGWLEARDRRGGLRIAQPGDWVRQEVELALADGKTLIPVVFGGSGMPPREELPGSIAALADQPRVTVRDEFPDDLQPVLRQIEVHLPGSDDLNIRADIGGDPRKLPYPDPPMPIRPSPMTETDIDIALGELLKDWEVVSGPSPEGSDKRREELYRTFKFRNFLDVFGFMAEVADFADKVNHHPRWENIYETLSVYLTTWDIGHRISHLDVQLAQFFDRVYQGYCDQSTGSRGQR